jgi:uncharacterized RDD family membrane protein YckC
MKYAGFWIRFVASMTDDFLVYMSSLALTYTFLFLFYLIASPAPSFGEAFTGNIIQLVSVGASMAIGFAYYTWMHFRYGQTIGKMFLKIKVIDEATAGPLTLKQSMGRYVAHIASALPFAAGYIMAAFNSKKKALHDTIAGTVSVMVEKTEEKKLGDVSTPEIT